MNYTNICILLWMRYRGENRATKFQSNEFAEKPSDYSKNCIFRMVDYSKHRAGMNIPVTIYPDFRSSIHSVPQSTEILELTNPKTGKISWDIFRTKKTSWDSFVVLVLSFLEMKSPKTMLSMLRRWWRYMVMLTAVCPSKYVFFTHYLLKPKETWESTQIGKTNDSSIY